MKNSQVRAHSLLFSLLLPFLSSSLHLSSHICSLILALNQDKQAKLLHGITELAQFYEENIVVLEDFLMQCASYLPSPLSLPSFYFIFLTLNEQDTQNMGWLYSPRLYSKAHHSNRSLPLRELVHQISSVHR